MSDPWHRECIECGGELHIPASKPIRCDACCAWAKAQKEIDAWKARAEAAEKDAAFHKMSALAFEDLHEAAEKRARDAEENAARWGHNIVVLQDALRDIEETTIAAVVALLRDMAFRWSEEGETKAEWIECTRANAEMLEHWRPKGREGGE